MSLLDEIGHQIAEIRHNPSICREYWVEHLTSFERSLLADEPTRRLLDNSENVFFFSFI